ncbi:MAG: hypothetical protein IJF26_01440 [Clostridia bacterium]|nr:hypothetical protein [Clostridia bacterium]
MKKITAFLLALLFTVSLAVGCTDNNTTTTENNTTTTDGGSNTTVVLPHPTETHTTSDQYTTVNGDYTSYSWFEKWDRMIKGRQMGVSHIHLVPYTLSSVFEDLAEAYSQNNDEIKVVLDELKELEFEITDNDTARNVGGGYVLEIIHNFYMNFDTETGGLITDETGTNYQYAIRLFVDFDGYVYVKDVSNTEESGQRWTDVKDTDIVFKSKTKIDFKKLDDIQKNNI